MDDMQREGAKWRPSDDSVDDAPRQQSMRAGIKPVTRKAPTTDQKKVRRQMAKSAAASHCPECGGASANHGDGHWHQHGYSSYYLDTVGNDHVARHRDSGQIGGRWTTRSEALAASWGDEWPDPRPKDGWPEEKVSKAASSPWEPQVQPQQAPQARPRVKTMERERTEFQPRDVPDDSDFDPYLVKRCPDHGSSVVSDRESQLHYLPVVIADHDHAMTHSDAEHRRACHGDGFDCWSCCPEMYIAKPGERESGRVASHRRTTLLPRVQADYQYVKPNPDGDGWVITQKGTGKILSHHDSEEQAKAAFRAMMAHKHGSQAAPSCPECGAPGRSEGGLGAELFGHVETPGHCKTYTWTPEGAVVARDVHTKAERDERADAFDAKIRALNPFLRSHTAGLPGVEHAGDRQCYACGHEGSPVLGDTGPACSQCGSYSLGAPTHRPPSTTWEHASEDAQGGSRHKNQGDFAVTSTRHTATQLDSNIARSDGTILIPNGSQMRLPDGKTTTIKNIRRHETSRDHFYVDTDLGTTLMPWSTKISLVPSEGQQQVMPGYGDPRGNSNSLPAGAGPYTNPGAASSKTVCPVCGNNTLVHAGAKAQCTSCGYSAAARGGTDFGTATQVVNPGRRASIHPPLSAVARRAAEVANTLEETL